MNTTHTPDQLKQLVKDKYTEVADQSKEDNETSCCGSSCCSTIDEALMAEDYQQLKGYVADADLGLGCGLPTQFAKIKNGDSVVDLGSGAGNDAFVARAVVGEKGKVIGVDFTQKMIDKARANAEKMGFNNVEFRQGDIEELPLSDNFADVVVSNCVMNLVPNKKRAFAETYRILKPGGHFSISDIVIIGDLPANIKLAAEMYAGCISGAIQKSDYIQTIREAGFVNLEIQKEKQIIIPDQILQSYLSENEIQQFRKSHGSILSITVYAEKAGAKNSAPSAKETEACCEPGCCGN